MKTYDHKTRRTTFYELISAPDPAGKVTRYHLVQCSKCNASNQIKSAGLSDESLKKVFTRQKWLIGKHPNQHLCPACNEGPQRHKEPAAPAKPAQHEHRRPSNLELLERAWAACSADEQGVFLGQHMQPVRKPSYVPPADFQHGPHIDSMPREANAAADPASQLAPTPAEEPGEDEPAEWWRELMRK